MTSTTVSTAPTSWKCTRSGERPWSAPSTSASRRRAARLRSTTRGGSAASRMGPSRSASVRSGCDPGLSTETRVALKTALQHPVDLDGGLQPQSLDRLPQDARETAVTGVQVEQGGEEHVTRDPGPEVQVEQRADDVRAALRRAGHAGLGARRRRAKEIIGRDRR